MSVNLIGLHVFLDLWGLLVIWYVLLDLPGIGEVLLDPLVVRDVDQLLIVGT